MFRVPISVFALLFLQSVMAQNFTGESVEYDPAGNRFFTSDDGTSIQQRAANGDLSYFGSGLSASLGMEVMNGKLYAIDGTTVYEYDLLTETQTAAVNVSGANFLNGMASDAATGRVWVTDFSAGRIIEIDFSVSSPSATTIVSSTQGTPNGVWHDAENNRLLYVTWGAGSIRSVDLANGNAISNELSVTGVSNIDGIDENNEGDFYISSWSPQPRITKVTSDFSATETITVVGLNNPADICYALEIDTLAIPSTSGAMVFVGFSSPNSLAERENVYSTSLFPNPTEGNSLLQFQLVEASTISVVVFDVHGKEVVNYGKAHYPAGPNSLFVTANDLTPGQYFIRLNGEESFSLERMIVVD